MSSLSSQNSSGRPVRSTSRDSNRGPVNPIRPRSSRSGAAATAIATRMTPVLGQLSNDQRQRVYEEVLNSNRPFLCRHLDPSRHYSYLRSQRYFDGTTVEKINHNVTSEDRVNSFIDELVKRGPNAVSAFMESLERNRVEQFVFSRLADDFQTFNIEDLDEPVDGRGRFDHLPNQADDNQAVYDDDETFSNQFGLLSVERRGNGEQPHDAVFPPIDVRRLREAQGLHLPESERDLEPEEDSDVSSIDGLVSHGN